MTFNVTVDAPEQRLVAAESRRRLYDEIAIAVDRHVRRGLGSLDGALNVIRSAGVGDDPAGDLTRRHRITREHVRETRIYAFVSRGLRVRDVARNILHRE